MDLFSYKSEGKKHAINGHYYHKPLGPSTNPNFSDYFNKQALQNQQDYEEGWVEGCNEIGRKIHDVSPGDYVVCIKSSDAYGVKWGRKSGYVVQDPGSGSNGRCSCNGYRNFILSKEVWDFSFFRVGSDGYPVGNGKMICDPTKCTCGKLKIFSNAYDEYCEDCDIDNSDCD